MTDIPKHLKRDIQKLSSDRTSEVIKQICDVFGNDPKILALVATSSMSASFLALYCSARLSCRNIEPQKVYEIWGNAMAKEFDFIQKGFDTATEFMSMSPDEQARYDS